jgi:hypothetical protein
MLCKTIDLPLNITITDATFHFDELIHCGAYLVMKRA